MQNKRLGLALFSLGVFLVYVYTTIPFIWALVGIPLHYPLMTTEGVLAMLPGFMPPLGALLLVVGGLIYGREAKEVIK
jgi:hypothetical protein